MSNSLTIAPFLVNLALPSNLNLYNFMIINEIPRNRCSGFI